jgi:hypothetical protein
MLKKIILIFTIFFSIFSLSFSWPTWWYPDWKDENIYSVFDKDSLKEWIEITKNTIEWIEKDKPFSEYVQSIVIYLLTFLSLIAVIYIIWAWINIMISGWDDDKLKNQKKTIISVIIWIVVIWLAYSLVLTIFKWLNNEGTWWANSWTQYNQIK